MFEQIEFPDFQKIKMAVGTVLQVELNSKARVPAYILTLDFGELGIKTSSAQITENYQPEDLIDQQVIAVMNFPTKRVAGVKSEVLVLASISDTEGTVLIRPSQTVANGAFIS